jgi:carbamoyltransferase
MKILGINFSIDSAAALLVDGEIVCAVLEERFTRRKHDASFPAKAIAYCLAKAGLSLADIDRVAFFWNPGRHLEPSNWRQTAVPRDHMEYLYSLPSHLMRHFDGDRVERLQQVLTMRSGESLTIDFLNHHDCHAAGAFFLSNFESSAILTVDGYGERASTMIARGRDQSIETLMEVEFPHSLGSLYAAFTQYLGFRANNGEGKVMGLASYGEASYYQAIRDLVTLTDDGFELDLSYFEYTMNRPRRYSQKLIKLLGPERQAEGPLDDRHQDIAASLQQVTEEVLLHLAERARALTGETRLCMAGGVVLNCVANTRVLFEAGFEEVYFMPASGDGGSSLGAALYAHHVLEKGSPRTYPASDYHGPSFSEEEVEAELKKSGSRYVRVDDIATTCAGLLADGKILGWFQGAAELGPRALGHRSILADPRRHEMKDVLNARVKFREGFRPFAPSILKERCGDFFEHAVPSPYMLQVYKTREDKLDTLPAITHVDDGARVQTVDRDVSPLYWNLIHAFGEATGVPVVLNTSFNIRGEPIVNSVADALKCFYTTDLDALAVGPFLLQKSL